MHSLGSVHRFKRDKLASLKPKRGFRPHGKANDDPNGNGTGDNGRSSPNGITGGLTNGVSVDGRMLQNNWGRRQRMRSNLGSSLGQVLARRISERPCGTGNHRPCGRSMILSPAMPLCGSEARSGEAEGSPEYANFLNRWTWRRTAGIQSSVLERWQSRSKLRRQCSLGRSMPSTRELSDQLKEGWFSEYRGKLR